MRHRYDIEKWTWEAGARSSKPAAIASRVRRLNDDGLVEANKKDDRRRYGVRKLAALTRKASPVTGATDSNWRKRIQFHLSRGRTEADIVIREGIPASHVVRIVQEIQGGPK